MDDGKKTPEKKTFIEKIPKLLDKQDDETGETEPLTPVKRVTNLKVYTIYTFFILNFEYL